MDLPAVPSLGLDPCMICGQEHLFADELIHPEAFSKEVTNGAQTTPRDSPPGAP